MAKEPCYFSFADIYLRLNFALEGAYITIRPSYAPESFSLLTKLQELCILKTKLMYYPFSKILNMCCNFFNTCIYFG